MAVYETAKQSDKVYELRGKHGREKKSHFLPDSLKDTTLSAYGIILLLWENNMVIAIHPDGSECALEPMNL